MVGKRLKNQTLLKKALCNEEVLRKRNSDDPRRTSTPIKPTGFKECNINLSPISHDVLSQLSKNYDCYN